MATVKVGLVTNDTGSPPTSSTSFKSLLETNFTSTHTYIVTYYVPSEISTALATEDILGVDLEGVNTDGGSESYGDTDGAFDAGIPSFAFGWGATVPQLSTNRSTDYQETGGSYAANPLDSLGILSSLGYTAGQNITITTDGSACQLTGTLAGGLEGLFFNDSDNAPNAAILPAGGAAQGGGNVTNSIGWLTPRLPYTGAADADAVNEAILEYLYQETLGGGGGSGVTAGQVRTVYVNDIA